MSTFAKPAKTAVYTDIIDRVMGMAKSNEAVYQYCVNLFIQAFENSIWEEVFVYVIDNYYLNSYVYNPQQGEYYKKKVATIKSLRLGKKYQMWYCPIQVEMMYHYTVLRLKPKCC
jgi:hypothetical protein